MGDGGDDTATDYNTLIFRLHVSGLPPSARKSREADEADDGTGGGLSMGSAMMPHTLVTSKDLVWLPQAGQVSRYADRPIGPVHDDILLAKLLPGQEINLVCHARKGIGMDHAKYQPVATASYRLLPDISIDEVRS